VIGVQSHGAAPCYALIVTLVRAIAVYVAMVPLCVCVCVCVCVWGGGGGAKYSERNSII